VCGEKIGAFGFPSIVFPPFNLLYFILPPTRSSLFRLACVSSGRFLALKLRIRIAYRLRVLYWVLFFPTILLSGPFFKPLEAIGTSSDLGKRFSFDFPVSAFFSLHPGGRVFSATLTVAFFLG